MSGSFPHLIATNHRITSAADSAYNCYAWACHRTDIWLEAGQVYAYWPSGIPSKLTLNTLTAVYAAEGFVRCDDGTLEPGCEKIAIYTDTRGLPLHAARQLPIGAWTSKMGQLEDIEHDSLDAISGPTYGRPARFLRRPIP